jgi:hypothetical protein
MAGPVVIREVEEDEARSFLANSAFAPPRYLLVDAHSPERAHYAMDCLGLVPSGGNRVEWAISQAERIERKYGTELVGVPVEAISEEATPDAH